MTATKLKNLMSVLLIATGVLHLAVAVIGAPADIRVPLAVFGAIYAALGVWVRSGGKPAVLTAMAATLTGILLGGSNYLQNGGPATLPIMFLIDVAILAAGAMALTKSDKSA
ncbi:MAG: hypothetical protein AB7F91_13810 [Parvularculaceae bacterium]